MFCKYSKTLFSFDSYTILPTSLIPSAISILDHCMYQLLQQIICLIQHKYNLQSDNNYNCIQARFNNVSGYKEADIMLLNSYSKKCDRVDLQNIFPLELLRQHKGVISKEIHPTNKNKYYLVVKLPTADLVELKESLEKLPEPTLISNFAIQQSAK